MICIEDMFGHFTEALVIFSCPSDNWLDEIHLTRELNLIKKTTEQRCGTRCETSKKFEVPFGHTLRIYIIIHMTL